MKHYFYSLPYLLLFSFSDQSACSLLDVFLRFFKKSTNYTTTWQIIIMIDMLLKAQFLTTQHNFTSLLVSYQGLREYIQLKSQSFTLDMLPHLFCLLFYPLCFCYPSYLSEAPFPSPLTHSEILTVMLKLAASISAPALAPRASKQEAEDASKTSLSNVHAHLCTESQRHKYSLYILIHSFLLTCTTERVYKCAKVPAHLSAHMHAHTHAYAHKDTHTHTDTDR